MGNCWGQTMQHGGSPQQIFRRVRRCGLLAAALLLGALLPGCASTLSSLPPELGGLPADTPARPAGEAPDYPAVHDMPPPRQTTPMTPQQLKQTEAEMMRAREQQARQAGRPASEATAEEKARSKTR